jgi:hypothetical protein
VETCNLILFHPPLRLSIFYGSRDQPRPGSFLKKREEPGNEVAIKELSKRYFRVYVTVYKYLAVSNMENLDQESNSQYQAEILIFFEPRFPTGRICLEEGKFTASYFLLPSVSEAAHYS